MNLALAQFELGVADLSQLPPDRGREVAFAGRSNAGKSSAINALTHRRKLAFVSKTPGRTQQINFFALGERRYLVDLPGYGYAKVAHSVQDKWNWVLGEYLRTRASLRALVIIMDIRHPLTPLDRSMLEWFGGGRPVLVLLTKADKLSKQQALRQLTEVRADLARCYPGCDAQLFSSISGLGVEEAGAFIERMLTNADTDLTYNSGTAPKPEPPPVNALPPPTAVARSGRRASAEQRLSAKKNPRLKGKTGG